MTTKTETPVEQSVADETQAQADFDAGAAMETVPGPKTPAQDDGQPARDDAGRFAKPEPKPDAKAKPEPKPAEKPEYVQLTKQQFERLETAAKRTDDFEKQMSKAFGTIGDVQKIVRTLQTQTPRGLAVKIPDGAFAAMEKDFPELAGHTRAALEATLKGLEGTGSPAAHVDVAEFKKEIASETIRLQMEDLDDAEPNWRQIVGQSDKPDLNIPFRKWLATKDEAYQKKINGTNSAGVITRAIRAFQSETKAKPAPVPPAADPRAKARANRIRDAIAPKGDGGHPSGPNAGDEFDAGFRTG